jgi:pilus assembly protein Flp/PilA
LEIGILRVAPRNVPGYNFYLERISIMLFASQEKGQGLVEYAIIIALIAIVVIAIMLTLGAKVNNTFNSMSNSLTL